MQEEKEFLNDVEPTNDRAIDLAALEDNPTAVPSMDSEEWSDYVLSQLSADEMFNGNPTVDGLRRIVRKLLGPIVRSETVLIQAPNEENNNHAAVEHVVEILWDSNQVDRRVFRDVSDIWPGNVPDPFAKRTSPTASTIAEGRALRRLLQLKRVYAAEEVGELPQTDPENITNSQIAWINMMCQRNDINVMKLLKNSKGKFTNIENVPYTTYVEMRKYLDNCQKGKQEVPESIKGYDPEWRKE